MVKKKTIVILIFSILLLMNRLDSVNALTYEGTTGTNAGGLTQYNQWFEDFTGVLILSSTFANGSGAEDVDINVMVSCIDPTRVFRLRVWDSDMEQYVNPDAEIGMGTHTRIFGLTIHQDTTELIWKAIVSDETGLVIFAEIKLYFIYDPDADYQPVIDPEDKIDREAYEKEKITLILRAWGWLLQSLASCAIAVFLAYKIANRLYGAG